MIEAQQWMIDLLLPDLANVLGGVVVLILLIELVNRVKEWLS
jgi:hypothetical protein